MKHIKKINEFVNNSSYNTIIDNLENETLIISSSSEIKSNKNYKKLLNEGEYILPVLLERIKSKNTMTICMLISDISGINLPNSDGDIEKIKEFYLNEFNN